MGKWALPLALCLLLAGCAQRVPAVAVPAPEPPPVQATVNPSLPPESSSPQGPVSSSQPEEEEPEPAASSEPPVEVQPPAPQEEVPDSGDDALAVFAVSALDDRLLERITGVSYRPDGPVAPEDLRLVTVTHLDFEGNTLTGRLIVNAALADEVAEIFRELYEAGFPIGGIALIDEYGGDDAASMAANNSSAFCVRPIAGTDRYSNHSYGRAIDINPLQNPYVTPGRVQPEGAAEYLDREQLRPGMIAPGDPCHTAFTSRGWSWGGNWPNPDYQHFEKLF